MRIKLADAYVLALVTLGLASCERLRGLSEGPGKACASEATRQGLLSLAFSSSPTLASEYKLVLEAPTLDASEALTKKLTCSANMSLQRVDGRSLTSDQQLQLVPTLATGGGIPSRSSYTIQPAADSGQPVYGIAHELADGLMASALRTSALLNQSRSTLATTATSNGPDFNGRDKDYVEYKTRIMEAFQEGPNFADHYHIVQFGCGTGCSFVFVVDTLSGQVFDFPLGGEDQQQLELNYDKNSPVVKAAWVGAEQTLTWTGRSFSSGKIRKLPQSRDDNMTNETTTYTTTTTTTEDNAPATINPK